MAAGPAVDALARQFAGRAVFIEQNVDAPIGNRFSRFLAAYADTGETAYETVYGRVVDLELTRAPQGEIEAYARRLGDRIRVYARLHNTSGVTLSAATNHAALHALVYEDRKVGVTGRIVRAAPWRDVSPALAPDGVLTTTIDTDLLSGVNWAALHTIVVADYVPGPTPAYDMLQADVASPPSVTVSPSTVTVGVDSGHPADRTVPVALSGPYTLQWNATPDVPWLIADPDAAAIGTGPTVTVAALPLTQGAQEGHVTFSASSGDGMSFTQFLTVTAVLGARRLRAVAPQGEPASAIALPIAMSALGDEHSVAFTLDFDPAALGEPSVALGGVDASLDVDDSGASSGRLGITLTLPADGTLPLGDETLVVVTFARVGGTSTGSTAISFSDDPAATSIRDRFGARLTAAVEDATVAVPTTAAPHAVRRHVQRPGS